MSLLPSRSDSSPSDDAGPRVVDVESDDAEAVIAALSSKTARKLLNELHDDPAPPANLAERVDTSVQNAKYHLDKLQDAGAIEVVDTAYSAKGREMDVYAPADQPLVIYAGDTDTRATLRSALSRLLGALGILAMASFVVQAVADQPLFFSATDDTAPTTDDPDDAEEPATDPSDPEADDDPTADEFEEDEGEPEDDGEVGVAEEPEEDEPTDDADVGDEPADDAPDSGFETADENLSDGEFINASDVSANGADDAHVIVELLGGLPPGVLFFAGGLLVLGVVAGFQYYRLRRGIPGQVV